ncbi:hypothetical protein [Rubrivivax gelatinosus]|uniref:hypothetical protein n=1 Tax=Rubrivivax gelatinosus TaxID=28068 RepID=UPI0011D1AD48|nr:hypothetical protein [Rubrivivax gelatinosus]
MSEDKRFSWKVLSRAVALVGAFFVTKTGVAYFDWALTVVTAFFLLIFIESQRSYSKLPPVYRKRSVRIAVVLGSWGVTLLGLAFFLQVALVSSASVFSKNVVPGLDKSASLLQALSVVLFLVAVPFAVIRVFRNLQFEELIYQLPRQGLKQLLVFKEPKVTSFAQFAFLELSILLVCLLYASSVANIAGGFFKLFAALS